MNPMQLLQIVNIWKKFCANHPRFPMFLQAVGKEGLTEDSVISIEVKTPEGKTYNANVKLLASDMNGDDNLDGNDLSNASLVASSLAEIDFVNRTIVIL